MASAKRDADSVARLLAKPPPTECLQAVGEAIAHLPQRTDDLTAVIARTVEELRQRSWPGDEQLAIELSEPDQLTELQAVPIDLEALGELLDGRAGTGGLLDLETGFVWSEEIIENARDSGMDGVPEEADGVRWIDVRAEGHGGRDMRVFITTVSDTDLVERLERSIRGRAAFRRFRDELERSPAEASRWHAFNDDRSIGRARAWLAEAGYREQLPPA